MHSYSVLRGLRLVWLLAPLATAAADGAWRVHFPAMAAGGPHTLTVEGAGARVTIRDVLVGDVRVASGQSNMEWPLAYALDGEAAAAAASDPLQREHERDAQMRAALEARIGGLPTTARAPQHRPGGHHGCGRSHRHPPARQGARGAAARAGGAPGGVRGAGARLRPHLPRPHH